MVLESTKMHVDLMNANHALTTLTTKASREKELLLSEIVKNVLLNMHLQQPQVVKKVSPIKLDVSVQVHGRTQEMLRRDEVTTRHQMRMF